MWNKDRNRKAMAKREAHRVQEREGSIAKKKTTASLMKVNSDFHHLQKKIARFGNHSSIS